MENTVCVEFTNIKWPSSFIGPTYVSRRVRNAFIEDESGSRLAHNDLKDVMQAYLHDELGEAPIDFDFAVGC